MTDKNITVPGFNAYSRELISRALSLSKISAEKHRLALVGFDQAARSVTNFPFAIHESTLAVHVSKTVNGILCKSYPELRTSERAILKIASLIDTEQACFKPKYHNVPHYLIVALTAATLGIMEYKNPDDLFNSESCRLTLEDVADLYLAGLIHDFRRPGGENGWKKIGGQRRYQCYRHEELSWKHTKPALIAAGYGTKRLERMHMLVLATDPVAGMPLVELALRYHKTPQDSLERMTIRREARKLVDKLDPDDLYSCRRLRDALFDNPKLAGLAYILKYADLSTSLMPETSRDSNQGLDAEHREDGGPHITDDNGNPIPAHSKYFHDNIVHDRRRFLLRSVERLLGKSARKTRKANLQGRYPSPQ
jgi:hypothetical protein